MKAFVSWSGGKDCSIALYSFLKNPLNKVTYLVNFINPKRLSVSLSDELLIAQSKSLNIPLLRKIVPADKTYEQCFKEVVHELKKEGVCAGIFGDIYLQEHRDWIERVCNDMGITAVFPLWGMETEKVIEIFLADGFRAVINSTNNILVKDLIGRELNIETINELREMQGIDICGERGEYHSFVFDSPMYSSTIPIICDEARVNGNNVYIPIRLEK